MWHNLDHQMTQAEAINDAHHVVMRDDKNVITVGEGVQDPRGLYGTTQGLAEKFGNDRVVNMPISENGVMGICTGAAMMGIKPILVFQNMEYTLLALSQLVTNTVRFSMLGGAKNNIPIVIRIMIGKNWQGGGPQCFQSLHTLLVQIKGLKIVMPVFPKDAKGMLIQAVRDPGPVVFIEHCWLYTLKGDVPTEKYTLPLDRANIVRQGMHITVAAFSFTVLQGIRAANALVLQGIELEIIDMRSARPLDVNTVLASIRKTGRLIVADSGISDNAIAAELITQITELGFNLLKSAPIRIDGAKQPVPFENTSNDGPSLENEAIDIANVSLAMLGRNSRVSHDRLADLLYSSERVDPNVISVG